MALDQLLKLTQSLQAFDTEAEVTRIVENNGERINELQQEQLAAGIDRRGKFRVDEYRPLTKLIKKEQGIGLGAVTDRVTFFMTGGLYRSLFTSFIGPTFIVKSTMDTYRKMLERIGEDNYGLSPDQCEEFRVEVTIPEFKKVWEKSTGLKIS